MATSTPVAKREGLALRVLWMLVFFFVWQLAELVLFAIVLVQLVLRLVTGQVNEDLRGFGDSLSQYIAQIGRFGTFNTEQKPWPFADWPAPRPAEVEQAPVASAAPPTQPPAAPGSESQPGAEKSGETESPAADSDKRQDGQP